MRNIPHWKAHLSLFLVNAFYGANHVIAKGIMPEILSPTVFIFLRVTVSLLLFVGMFLLFTKRERILKEDFWRFVACGLFGVAVNQMFFFHGLNLSSSINSGIIMTLNPILVALLSIWLLKEKMLTGRLAGILLGALGAILLTISSQTKGLSMALGDIFLLINATSYALYLVLVKPLMTKYTPFTVITYNFLFGWIFILLFPPTWSGVASTEWTTIDFYTWLKIAYVIVCVTFLAYLLTIYALRPLSPTVSASYIYLQPVLVIVFTYLFFYLNWAEDYRASITWAKITYMLMIFAGVYLTIASKRKERKSQKLPA